jgi:hypothetical protein
MYLLLVCDPETNKWHINTQTEDPIKAHENHDSVNDGDTKSILIHTGDFIQV